MEFLVELVLQLVVEVLGEVAWEGSGKLLSTRTGRLVTSAVAGFFGGLFWGIHLRNDGQTATPRTVWVSLILAVAGVIASLAARNRALSTGEEPDPPVFRFLPWRWTPHQWEGFALLNAFVAAGCALGFGP